MGAARRPDAEAHVGKLADRRQHALLVCLLDRDKDVAGAWHAHARTQLRFCEGHVEAGVEAHDLAG